MCRPSNQTTWCVWEPHEMVANFVAPFDGGAWVLRKRRSMYMFTFVRVCDKGGRAMLCIEERLAQAKQGPN